MFVARQRYAAVKARNEQLVEERDTAQALADERLCTIVRLCREVDELRDKAPDAPVQQPRPLPGDVEVRRLLRLSEKARAALDERCCELEKVNEVQARELREHAEQAREVTGS